MEDLVNEFAAEFIKDSDIFLNDDFVDFDELRNSIHQGFKEKFKDVSLFVVPPVMSTSNLDIEKQLLSFKTTSFYLQKMYKKTTVVVVFLGIWNGAMLAHSKYKPPFAKEWDLLSRRSIKIFFKDGTTASSIHPYYDDKSYDLHHIFTDIEHFLDDDAHCTCCLSNKHETKKALLRCFHCSTFLCKDCYYKCKVNKTGLCITCKQNFGAKSTITKKGTNLKITKVDFSNLPKPPSLKTQNFETGHINEDYFTRMVFDDFDLFEVKEREFKEKLKAKYGDITIIIPKPFGKSFDTFSIQDATLRLQVAFKTMITTTKPVIVVLLGVLWGVTLSKVDSTSALFPQFKGRKILTRSVVFTKDSTNDVSHVVKGFSDETPYDVENIIDSLDIMNVRL